MQLRHLVIGILTPLVSGGATFGAIALHQRGFGTLVGSQRVHAASQSSPEPDVLLANWPQQCEVIKQELLSQPELSQVMYEARPIKPFVTPAWKLTWQGETLALPLANYSYVQVSRNEDGQYFVLLEDAELGTRVMLNYLKQAEPLADVFATVPHPSLSLAQLQAEPNALDEAEAKALAVKQQSRSRAEISNSEVAESRASSLNWDGPGLTERLFDGPVALEQLMDQGYRHRPQALSCKAKGWEQELPIALGLALKVSTGNGQAPEAVYASVAQQPSRLLKYRSSDKTTWQARFGTGGFYSDVMISLPSDHESAEVGLGLGQENWWDAEPRPEWLIALERAVEVDTAYAWQALFVELQRAGIHPVGIQGNQSLIP